MRGPPTHDFSDTLMKQKVADSVLHRVVGADDANNGSKVGNELFVFCHQPCVTNPSKHSSTHTTHMLAMEVSHQANRRLISILGCTQTI